MTGVAGTLDGAESVAQRSGMTNKKCDISKFKLAKAVLRPGKTARTVLGAAAEEISERRSSDNKEEA